MAGCSDPGCNCKIVAGSGVSVTGSGTPSNPFVITADNALRESFSIRDTDTVNLTLLGAGTPDDKFVLSADATITVEELADINDPAGPVPGDTLVRVGVGEAAHWEFSPPPANPPGAVNVGQGLTGTGAAGSPIAIKTLNPAGGSTGGLEVYVDSAGNLRAVAPVATAVDWSTIVNKPTTFPPSAHTHTYTDITDRTSMLDAGGVAGHKFYVQQTDPGAGAPDGSVWISWT